MRRTLTSAAACTVAALAVAACSGGASSTSSTPGATTSGGGASGGQQYANGKTLTMTLPSDPGTLDPDLTALSVAIQADYFLYDPLVNIQPDGSLASGLATAWTGDTTSASFTLKKGVSCSDGSPLTASDVAANINFIGNPKNASPKIGIWVPPTATATGDDSTGVVTVKSPVPGRVPGPRRGADADRLRHRDEGPLHAEGRRERHRRVHADLGRAGLVVHADAAQGLRVGPGRGQRDRAGDRPRRWCSRWSTT